MKDDADYINAYEELERFENVYENESMDSTTDPGSAGYDASSLRLYNKSTHEKAGRDACCARGSADVHANAKADPIADAKTGAAAQAGTSA